MKLFSYLNGWDDSLILLLFGGVFLHWSSTFLAFVISEVVLIKMIIFGLITFLSGLVGMLLVVESFGIVYSKLKGKSDKQ